MRWLDNDPPASEFLRKDLKSASLHNPHPTRTHKVKVKDNSKSWWVEACWVDCWEQIERMPKLPPRASSTSAQGATHPPFYWNINQPPIQWHQILFHSFENWKMPSATSLTVALTMKTNTPVSSIGFQYIRQLAKFGRKRSFIQTPPFFCTRLWRSWSKRFPSLFFNIKLPFFWPLSVPLPSGSYYCCSQSYYCRPAVHIDDCHPPNTRKG